MCFDARAPSYGPVLTGFRCAGFADFATEVMNTFYGLVELGPSIVLGLLARHILLYDDQSRQSTYVLGDDG